MKQIAILTRPSDDALYELNRFKNISEALTRRGLNVSVVHFTEEALDEARSQLLQQNGVLVWVDPISNGRDRSQVDPLLRDVANEGVWVSAHPDVILKMGTKDVLFKTRDMPWGTDCYRYDSLQALAQQLPLRLISGPRVLKQHRGNGGNGTWKVELLESTSRISLNSTVRILHAQRASRLEEMKLAQFVERCGQYFERSGCMIDQPYQSRLADGMIRAYIVFDHVAGFGHQYVTALMNPPEATTTVPLPLPRLYFGPDRPEYQAIRAKLDAEWVKEMQRVLDIETEALPSLWDVDFLYGPRDAAGEDTYVLCEINVSSVSPFPDEALEPLAQAVARRLDNEG